IRDKLVTGVQTCALPIYGEGALVARQAGEQLRQAVGVEALGRGEDALRHLLGRVVPAGPPKPARDRGAVVGPDRSAVVGVRVVRSEERRVGKEWRARWCA